MVETFEAREKKIGSIRIVKNPNFPSGTHLQGYIKTNRAELRKVFGNPNMGESSDGKAKGKEWNLVVGGKRVTIYDRREMGKKGTKYFNIGGDGKYSALLVAQALSIHRNERVYAKEITPKWLEDRSQYQQVKSIDEHPDLTYERAKEYEDNRRRYRAEYAYRGHAKNYHLLTSDGKATKCGMSGMSIRFMDKTSEYSKVGSRSLCGSCAGKNAETFDVEFNEWAEQEMMSHGKDISFKDWAEDEGMKHGNVPITEWAEHEEESHDARYGAEDYQKKMYQDFLDNWDDEWEGSPPTFEEWKELVKDAEDWGGDPKGQLALALQKARENAKKPKKPLKIEKLDAEIYDGTVPMMKTAVASAKKSLNDLENEFDVMTAPRLQTRARKLTKKIGGNLRFLEDVVENSFYAETSGQWEIGEQLEEAQMNAEGKKRSGQLSDPFDELSLDSGGWKSIAIGFGVATLTLFGLTKLRK